VSAKETGLPFQVSPNQPVTLKRAAMRALRIFSRYDPELPEFPGVAIADRTMPLVPEIDQTANAASDFVYERIGCCAY